MMIFINRIFMNWYDFSIKAWRISDWVKNNIQIQIRDNTKTKWYRKVEN